MPLDKDRWQAISPYLDLALGMDDRDLAAWLASLRAEKPELAADLQILLEDRDALGRAGFLEEAVLAPSPASLAGPGAGEPDLPGDVPDADPTAATPPDRTIGTVGPYRLIRLLGEGGMGAVYLAEQTGPIRRTVALKVIRPGLGSASVLARFAIERQTLASLDHPGVSKIYDAGATSDGRPYVAMEYVAGPSLTRFCDERRMTVRERLDLFLQVCAAIQHAHQKGILHRDIKPSNLLVSIVDEHPVAKVIDFGIAKALEPALGDDVLFTQTGAMLGTPEYMSPEQAMTDGGGVDTRSDVYALGVVLYELLVGARPFEAKDFPGASSPYALLGAIRDNDPPKPTERLMGMQGSQSEIAARRGTDLKRLLRQLGGELEWITLRALEKQPAHRYASAAEMAADIERHLEGETVLAGPPSTLYRLRKLARRHRVAVGVIASVAVVTVLLGVTAIWFQRERRIEAEARSRQEAVLRQDAEQSGQLAREQLRESLLNQARALTSSSELDRRSRALAALKQAAGILSGVDLRNAAIAAMAAPELRVLRRWTPRTEESYEGRPDTTLRRYTRRWTDGTVSVHAIDDDEEIVRLPGSREIADETAFSPDGTWLAVRYHNQELRVWHLPSRTSRLTVGKVNSFVFTGDSERIIVSSANVEIRLFQLESGRELSLHLIDPRANVEGGGDAPFPPIPGGRGFLAAHPTEPLFLLSGYGWRVVEIRRVSDGGLERKLSIPEGGLTACWSGDGKSLITTHMDFTLRVWNWPDMGMPRMVLRPHRAEPTYLATDPSGQWLASTGWDNQGFFFDLRDGRLLTSMQLLRVYAATNRSAFVLGNEADWTLAEFDPAFGFEAVPMHENYKSPRDVSFSPTGRWLATGVEDGVRVMNLRSREVHRLTDERTLRAAFDVDSDQVYCVTQDRLLGWRIGEDRATGRFVSQRLVIPGNGERSFRNATTAGIFPFGDGWVTVGRDRRTGRAAWIHGRFDSVDVETSEGYSVGSSSPQVSPDGKWLAWGNWHGRDAGVTRFGEVGSPVVLPVAGNASVAFSPDNRLLVVGGQTEVRFYEVGTWRTVHEIPRRPPGPVPSFTFSNDSRLCAMSFPPTRVILVDTATGKEVVTLPSGSYVPGRSAFSPDDRILAVSSVDHHVLLWDLTKLRRGLGEIGLDWK